MNDRERWLVWRRRLKLSQIEAGVLVGANRSMVQRIERGEVSPMRYMEDVELPKTASPGEEFWLMRKRHALTKEEAAALLGCSRTQVYLLEAGKLKLDRRDLPDIEKAYRAVAELPL